jgi:predicted RND superfamily exporter protein
MQTVENVKGVTMKTVAKIIVEKRTFILAAFVLLAVICAFLIPGVTVNYDMSKYLPDDSVTKAGMELLNAEFPVASSLNIMLTGLSAEQKLSVAEMLATKDVVETVSFDADDEKYNKDGYTLFSVSLSVGAYSAEARALVEELNDGLAEYDAAISGESSAAAAMSILPQLFGAALLILFAILFLMCHSWLEPFLFLITIGIAVVINMGTNIIFGSVSNITMAIGSILQLVLSMDYSIMLIDRFRQEKQVSDDKTDAMKKAVRRSFIAISSSAVTTIVGMLALVFMSFTIGRDIGLVLAKGVFFSLLCIFTVLPALILMFNTAIEKTAKKPLHIKTGGLGKFSYSARYVISGVFVVLFAVSFFLRGNVGIDYTMEKYNDVRKVFTPDNPIVLLYENTDEAELSAFVETWETNAEVQNVSAYSNTLGKAMTAAELSEAFGLDAAMVGQILGLYASYNVAANSGGVDGGVQDSGGAAGITLSPEQFVIFLLSDVAENPAFAAYLNEEALAQVNAAKTLLDSGKAALVGERYSRVIINTALPEESAETFNFIAKLEAELSAVPIGDHYLVGSSVVAYEMSNSFSRELDFITVLTAAAVFAVVLIAFRSFWVPLILVLLIQCAVFITMGTVYISGSTIYYLPLLVVQCLLMGATIDYGILYISFYREAREKQGKSKADAVAAALDNAIHTVMTSALILIAVTFVLALLFASSQQAISEILSTIAKGAVCSAVLVVFILPGIVAALDKLVVRSGKAR